MTNIKDKDKETLNESSKILITDAISTILETQMKLIDDNCNNNTNNSNSYSNEREYAYKLFNIINDIYSNKGKNYRPYTVIEWATYWYEHLALNGSPKKYVKGKFSPNSYKVERVRLKYIESDTVFSKLKIDEVSSSDLVIFASNLTLLKDTYSKAKRNKRIHMNGYENFGGSTYSYEECFKTYKKVKHLLACKNNNTTSNTNKNNKSYTKEVYEKNLKYAKEYDLKKYNDRQISVKSKKNILDFLRMAFRCAKNLEIIKTNPFDNFTFDESREKINLKKVALNERERDIFLKACEGHKYFDLYLLMAYTGMRRSEVCGLTKGSINLEENYISISKQLCHDKDAYWGTSKNCDALIETKSMHSIRNIPISSSEVKEMLERRCASLDNDDDFVFGDIDCDIFVTRNELYPEIKKIFNKCYLVTGNKKYLECNNHTLRHTFATIFLTIYPEHLVHASALLGHASTAFTAKQYVHLDTEKIDISKMEDRSR